MVENVPHKKLSEFKPENTKDDVRSHTSDLSIDILSDVDNFVNQITSFLVSKFSRNPEMKTIIEIILEDLVVLLPYPEWAGSEVLLVGFMRTCLLTIQNQNFQNIEIPLFDILGKICESLVDIRKSTSVMELSTATEFTEFQLSLELVFGHIQNQAKKNSRYNLAAQYLAVKQLAELKKMENHVDKTDLQLAGLNSESENVTGNDDIIHSIQLIHSFLLKILLGESNVSLTGSNLKTQYIDLILRGDLFSLYENVLNLLSKSLESPKIKTKSKAIRTLSMLIDKDADILVSQRIQESVSLRLTDNSLSVRDAVIDLFGKIVDWKPELLQNFYKPICECINDPSVQVRKRVIKLMGGMFDSLDSNRSKVYVTAKLLMGLYDEEDSVIDLIKSLLVQIWFDTDKTSNLTVLLDIVGLGGKILKAFEEFLTKDLIKDHRDAVEYVTIWLLDEIHDMKNPSEVERSLKLISTFVKSDAALINQDQLISLKSFLVEDKNEGDITFYNLEILKHVLPGIDSLRPNYLQSAQDFLIQNLAKFNIKELNEAMPCIWRLCQMKKNTVRLANACVSCMKMLRPFIENKNVQEPNPRLEKLIHLLGSFGTHCKFEEFRELFLKSSLGFKEKESIVSGIVKYLLYFCEGDGRVKNAAIKNIMNVCITHPKFFMSDPILRIFDSEFEKGNPLILHSIIKGLLKFLILEENHSEKQNGTSKKMSNKLKLDLDVFHGNSKSYMTDGICAGLVQRYMDRILELCLHDSNTLSFSCVELLQLVISQGFANPRTCIPTVIALEASDNRRIRSIAVSLHSELYEKHESLTDTSYFEGTKLAMKYAKNNRLSFFEKDGFVSDLYGVVKSNYSSRKKFVQSIIKFVQVRSDTQEPKEQRDEVIWICLNLGNTIFYSMEEVLKIINRIDVVLEDEGVEISEQLNNEDLSELKGSKEFDSQVYLAQSFLAILQLRDILVTNYGITTNQIESFRPHRVDNELKQQVKTISEKKKFIVDVKNDPIDYIVQYLQAIKDYL
jgi:cohesin loading factor subunit SCC2